MARFENITSNLTEPGYTKTQLTDWIHRYYPHYDLNSLNWVIGQISETGFLFNLGFDCYCKPHQHSVISSFTDVFVDSVISSIHNIDSRASYCFYRSDDLASFIDLEPSISVSIFQVEKKHLYPLFLALSSSRQTRILLNPSFSELLRYYTPSSLVLYPLPSKCPVEEGGAYSEERLCVDLIADKTLRNLMGGNLEDAAFRLLMEEDLNIKTLLSYAIRRNVLDKAIFLLKSALPEYKKEILNKSSKFLNFIGDNRL